MNSDTAKNSPEEIDLVVLLADMVEGLKHWWGIFVVLISVLSTIAYFGARLTYSPYYTAYATFTVNMSSAVSYNSQGQRSNVTRQMGEIFPSILTSDALRSLVEEDLGYGTENPMPAEIGASVVEDTNLVTLTVSSPDPRTAYEVLETVLDDYPAISEKAIGEVELKMMDESGLPDEPANPPAFRKAALTGLGVGVLLSIVWLVIFALTRRTIRSEEDLKRNFNLDFLGNVPMVTFKKRKKNTDNLVMVDEKGISSLFVEAVRTVRHRVEKASENSRYKIRTILVTSAVQAEGKTTISTNLAVALANRGHSVLLIDGDLRNPSVGQAMGLKGQRYGTVDLLAGRCGAEDVLVPYRKIRRLRVIPGGQPVMNPTALWGRNETAELLTELRRQYEFIIVDAPPSAVVSDASLIAGYMDGCIFVVRNDFARIDVIRDGIEMFSGTDCRMIGCVLNHADTGFGGYGYGRGYGYGYGYGYGRGYGYGYGYGYGDESAESDENEEEDPENVSVSEDSSI